MSDLPSNTVITHLQKLIDLRTQIGDEWKWLDLLFEAEWVKINYRHLDTCTVVVETITPDDNINLPSQYSFEEENSILIE